MRKALSLITASGDARPSEEKCPIARSSTAAAAHTLGGVSDATRRLTGP
jgi:hypothetical protein